MKKIVHLQVPMNNGNISIDYNSLHSIYERVKEALEDEYYVIVTPLEPTITEYIKNINIEELYNIPYDEWYSYIKYKMDGDKNEEEV